MFDLETTRPAEWPFQGIRLWIGSGALLVIGTSGVLAVSFLLYQFQRLTDPTALAVEVGNTVIPVLVGAPAVGAGLIAYGLWARGESRWRREALLAVGAVGLALAFCALLLTGSLIVVVVLESLAGYGLFSHQERPWWSQALNTLVLAGAPALAGAFVGLRLGRRHGGVDRRAATAGGLAAGAVSLLALATVGGGVVLAVPFAVGLPLALAIPVIWPMKTAPRGIFVALAVTALVYPLATFLAVETTHELLVTRATADAFATALSAAGGPPPASCANGTPLPRSSGSAPRQYVLGAEPVWLAFVSPDPARVELREQDAALYGLGSVLLDESTRAGNLRGALFTFWDIPKDFADPVTLRMTEAASGEPVRVWSERRPAPETSATFVRSGYNNDGYDRHSADFFIPRAGCYVLEASWPGGSWTVRLAAGQ